MKTRLLPKPFMKLPSLYHQRTGEWRNFLLNQPTIMHIKEMNGLNIWTLVLRGKVSINVGKCEDVFRNFDLDSDKEDKCTHCTVAATLLYHGLYH